MTKTVTQSMTNSTVSLLTFIRGFSFTTSTEYAFGVTAVYSSTSEFNTTLTTQGDCSLLRLSYDVLIVYTALLDSGGYFLLQSSTLFDNNDTSATTYSVSVSNYDTTVFAVGLREISGQSASSFRVVIGWSISPSVAGDTATVDVAKSNIDTLSYSYIQIGEYVAANTTNTTTNTTTPTTPTAESGGGGSIGIILGVVVAILAIVITVLLLVRYCPGKKTYNVPSRDDFRSLPSLTF